MPRFIALLIAALVALIVNFSGGIVVVNYLLGFIPIPGAFMPNVPSLVNDAIKEGILFAGPVFSGHD